MPDMEKVRKGLEWILDGDRFGFGENWHIDSEPKTEEEQAGFYIQRAIALLKEQNGLIPALEQANAVINYLNEEKEKAIRDIDLYIADAENDAKTPPRTGKCYFAGMKYGLIIAKEIMQGKRNYG